jgi:hypothetical protein
MPLSTAALVYLTGLLQTACPQVTGTDGISVIWYQSGATCQAAAQTAMTNFLANPVVPNPGTIPLASFLGRFTQAQMATIWKAAQTDGTGQIGGGLMYVQSNQQITLTDPNITAWMAAVVTAGALTQAQATAILTP